ncbi:nucleotidyltransferase family protein [Pedobacter sp. HDW13]|uniref:nucleotidyltransferase family protein n=1 Tax=unclassified Pedobacter TaxID=2628915 RepID=UPI000F58F4D4|nr:MULTISPECIES: nucleotidyltransferase family protein [unclassified Pedobacter]QIL42081.1 nucleotidyltransferase family protein [Pedobacter sp. HDW13]RQO76686.1 nucleotidyltransferase family protein [Pedobacter sp. KBW01]
MKTGIIMLAGGNSSRLGQAKQLLTFNGKQLIDIVTEAMLTSGFSPVLAVLGGHAGQLTAKLKIDFIINQQWEAGISTSIVAGLSAMLQSNPDLDGVILSVSDQPFISAAVFKTLFETQQISGKGIVASQYASTMGTPVLFTKKYFAPLLALSGNSGAKAIIVENPNDVATIAFEMGHIDIDTMADYTNLTQQHT